MGNWQRHRAADKEAQAAQFAAAAEFAAGRPRRRARSMRRGCAFASCARAASTTPARQLFIDNKVYAGRAGYHVVAPLQARRERALRARRSRLDRARSAAFGAALGACATGAADRRRSRQPAAAALPRARVRARHAGRSGRTSTWAASPPPPGSICCRSSSNRPSRSRPRDGLVRDWPAPDLGADQNRSYMLQWYSFAALAVVLWLTLNWRARDGNGGA